MLGKINVSLIEDKIIFGEDVDVSYLIIFGEL